MLQGFSNGGKLSEMIAISLKEMIIDDRLAPGDRMPTEGELIQRFNVSRSSIREAVKLLQAEGILEIRRGQGTYVAENMGITSDPLGLRFSDQATLLNSLMEVRELIEPGTAYLAALRRTDDDLRNLRDVIDKMDEAYREKKDYTAYDISFHTAIADCTHNDVLHRLLPVINESILTGYSQTANVEGSYNRARQCHFNLFMAIAASDPDAARTAAEKHIHQTLDDSKMGEEKKKMGSIVDNTAI